MTLGSPRYLEGERSSSLQVASAKPAAAAAPLAFTYLSARAYSAPQPPIPGHVLAAVIHGADAPSPRPWPQVLSGLKPLDGGVAIELLHSCDPPVYATENDFDLAITDELLFGAWRPGALTDMSLESLSEALYNRLFAVIDRLGFPHLQRIWNVVPAINGEERGMERYKLFCKGRHAAYSTHLPDIGERYPAASAVGSKWGSLCVYFLAARSPGQPIENPKQISAYNYPRQYGPKSPSFSRALVRQWQDQACLFLSGTASIKGHESKHNGALSAQASETLDNLETLVANASQTTGVSFGLMPESSVLKAYVRRTADFPALRDFLGRQIGQGLRVVFLEADICRAELLLELDGAVFSAPSNT